MCNILVFQCLKPTDFSRHNQQRQLGAVTDYPSNGVSVAVVYGFSSYEQARRRSIFLKHGHV